MEEDKTLSWMEAEKDESHKAEVKPLLFGTGNLSLQDAANKGDTFDVEQGPSKVVKYGATANGGDEEDDEDSDDEDSDDEDRDDEDDEETAGNDKAAEKTVITSARSATSSKQSSKASKKAPAPAKKKNPKSKKGRQIAMNESGKPEFPHRNCLMAAFHFIESVGVITCLALMGTQAIPLLMIPLDELGIANICLKIYISLFCILFVLVEWDVPIGFLKDASFLQAYVSAVSSMLFSRCVVVMQKLI